MSYISKSVDFLAENNACGQTLLQLTSRGNAVIAELFRLTEFVPKVFVKPEGLYGEILLDFSYFQVSEALENRIETTQSLQDIDEELRENYLDVLTRFFHVFESVYSYVTDLKRYVDDLEEGMYIQQSLETVLQNVDGKQLLAETLFLYGVMLLVIDERYDGETRERLLVAYHRYSGHQSSHHSKIDDVCFLLRSTKFNRNGKRPLEYPEKYLGRVPISSTFIKMVIGRLRSDDLYNQIGAFPLPEHRSAALAIQASMLYVCLYFEPDILRNQPAVMREIVDKYFSDNWMISIYMGLTVNLVEAWEPYKAAKSALTATIEPANVRNVAIKHVQELGRISLGLDKFLSEATLTKEYILANTNKLLTALRRCNVTLRWLLVHSTQITESGECVKKVRQLREQVVVDSKLSRQDLFRLLLSTAQFELKLNEQLKEMLAEKEANCKSLQTDVSGRLEELVEVFSGQKPLIRVQKNEKLQSWFGDLKKEMELLDFGGNVSVCGRKLVQLIRALEEVQEFHNLDSNKGVSQFLQEIRGLMHQLLLTLNIREDTLVQIHMISDFSYAWEIIDKYTALMQEGIKSDPTMAIQLRATFLKLGSALNLPLLRIQQANSPDLVSVSQFYSQSLVHYVRKVLQVIPETVFTLLARIVTLQATRISELPARLEKEKLKDYARLDDRYLMAKLTHSISVLTEGVLMMKTTFVGIVKVDPKQVLEDGIRKELVCQVATAMHTILQFNPKAKQSELVTKLTTLSEQIEAFRRSFLYISDYVNLCGLRIWQEEFSRIINYNIEQECNVFLKIKIHDKESVYQSKVIPIPHFAKITSQSDNFIGRLTEEILKETDPRSTAYVHSLGTWYDSKTRGEKISPQFFKLLFGAVGNIGVSGLDRLTSFKISYTLEQFLSRFQRLMGQDNELPIFLSSFESLQPFSPKSKDPPSKIYNFCLTKHGKLVTTFVELLSKIGQLQALRLQYLREVGNAARFQSKMMVEALNAVNRSLLTDIEAYAQDSSKPYPAEDNALMYELTAYLEAAGITEPLKKIYTLVDQKTSHLSGFIFLLIASQLPKLSYTKHLGLLAKKSTDGVDGTPLVIGIVTVMQHMSPKDRTLLLNMVGALINKFLAFSVSGSKSVELPSEEVVLLSLLLEIVAFGGFNSAEVRTLVPASLIDQYNACL